MVGLDANLLVSAYRDTSPFHIETRALLDDWGESGTPFGIFLPTVYAFLRVVTHPRVFSTPTDPVRAISFIQALVALPHACLLTYTERHLGILERVLRESGASGNLVYDAHLVVLALEHGVDEILTFDGDFARFPQVKSRHPFRPGRPGRP